MTTKSSLRKANSIKALLIKWRRENSWTRSALSKFLENQTGMARPQKNNIKMRMRTI